MELFLSVRGSQETQPRLYPLTRGRTWKAGRYIHLGGPLVDGRFLRTQGPLLDKDEYIPLEGNLAIGRYHFEAGCDETGPWVRDQGVNGTHRNGTRLPPRAKVPLHLDDELRIAHCTVRVVASAPIDPAWLAWNDGTVVKLALAFEQEPSFDILCVLADALEEAGCADADLLNHCRQPAEHLRGCGVVDLLLRKEPSRPIHPFELDKEEFILDSPSL